MDKFSKRPDNNGVTVVVFYPRFIIQTIGSLLNPCSVACFCVSIFTITISIDSNAENNSQISQIVAVETRRIIIITTAFFGLNSLVNDLAMTHNIKTQA